MTARADRAGRSDDLAEGMTFLDLPSFEHERGSLRELFRQSWLPDVSPVQWNLVRSAAGVMRGMHIHLGITEYYLVLEGRLVVGWRDVRPKSPSEDSAGLIELRAEQRRALCSPTGICHGLYCPEPTTILVGVTTEWDPANEIGCHWRDPDLGIPWPFRDAVVSERDDRLPPLREILHRVSPWPGA